MGDEKRASEPSKANSLVFIMKRWIPYLRAKYGRWQAHQLNSLYHAIYAVAYLGENPQAEKIPKGIGLFMSLRELGSLTDMHPVTVSKYLGMLKETNPPLLADVTIVPRKGTRIIVVFPITYPHYTDSVILRKKRKEPAMTENKQRLLTQLAGLVDKYHIGEDLLDGLFKEASGRKLKVRRLYSEKALERVIQEIESVQCKDVQMPVQRINEQHTVHPIL